MSKQKLILELQKKAIKALQDSTNMLNVSFTLIEQGNHEEARRLQNEARAKRNDSVWLMSKANALETISVGNRSDSRTDPRSLTRTH